MAVKKSDEITVMWTGTAGIEQAKNLHDNLLDAFKNAKQILLDISKLEDIDISGIQLIIASKKEAEKQNKTFFITGEIPAAILDFTSGCGVSLSDYALPKNDEKEEKNA